MIYDNPYLQMMVLGIVALIAGATCVGIWRGMSMLARAVSIRMPHVVAPRASRRPQPQTAGGEQVGLDGQWSRLHRFAEATLIRTEHVCALHATAAVKLQASEYALANLLDEMRDYLPIGQIASADEFGPAAARAVGASHGA